MGKKESEVVKLISEINTLDDGDIVEIEELRIDELMYILRKLTDIFHHHEGYMKEDDLDEFIYTTYNNRIKQVMIDINDFSSGLRSIEDKKLLTLNFTRRIRAALFSKGIHRVNEYCNVKVKALDEIFLLTFKEDITLCELKSALDNIIIHKYNLTIQEQYIIISMYMNYQGNKNNILLEIQFYNNILNGEKIKGEIK